MAKDRTVLTGRIREGDGWAKFKIIHLKSDFYEMEIEGEVEQFIHFRDAVNHIMDNYGQW